MHCVVDLIIIVVTYDVAASLIQHGMTRMRQTWDVVLMYGLFWSDLDRTHSARKVCGVEYQRAIECSWSPGFELDSGKLSVFTHIFKDEAKSYAARAHRNAQGMKLCRTRIQTLTRKL